MGMDKLDEKGNLNTSRNEEIEAAETAFKFCEYCEKLEKKTKEERKSTDQSMKYEITMGVFIEYTVKVKADNCENAEIKAKGEFDKTLNFTPFKMIGDHGLLFVKELGRMEPGESIL
jgi:hypothetical protein